MKLLVLEQWHLGDLALAAPFLRAAAEKYDVSLVAKPIAADLRKYFWPEVEVFPFNAPWTAFERKYDLRRWPWQAMGHVVRELRSMQFDIAVSARWDPRDHLLMALSGAKRRIGFPRLHSHLLLTEPMDGGTKFAHRLSQWQRLANLLGFEIPRPPVPIMPPERDLIIIHTGARRMTRAWPLERYARLLRRLRAQGRNVKVLCDPGQLEFWRQREERATVPGPVDELVQFIKTAGIFIGNDSGPGHIAAISGIPTFTIFGPQEPELFAPIHPESEWIAGAPCPFKPCYDSCRFSSPHCLLGIDEETVWKRVERFVARLMPPTKERDGLRAYPDLAPTGGKRGA